MLLFLLHTPPHLADHLFLHLLLPRYEVYPPALSHPVSPLLPGQPYSFWVTAATLAGEGPSSPIVTESPLRYGLPCPLWTANSANPLNWRQ